jgi:hypothetical protein
MPPDLWMLAELAGALIVSVAWAGYEVTEDGESEQVGPAGTTWTGAATGRTQLKNNPQGYAVYINAGRSI